MSAEHDSSAPGSAPQPLALGPTDAFAPIFLIGCPRSGTTMLASLLEHTPWGIPYETQFVTKYFHRLERYGLLSERANMKRLLKDILAERAVLQWELNLDLDDFCDGLDEPTYACLANALCRLAPDRTSAVAWGDKTPHYVLDLDVIEQLFPQSKIIVIVRDGRDAALSMLKTTWGPRNIVSCARYWARCHQGGPVAERLMQAGRLQTVRYEDLLQNPQPELSRLLDFLGADDDRQAIMAAIPTVRKDNSNKWRQQMSPKQTERFEQIAASVLEAHGYETSFNEAPLGLLTEVAYWLHEKSAHAWYLFKLNVIEGIQIRYFGKQPFVD